MKRVLWYIMVFLAIGIAGYAVVQYLFIGANKAGFMDMKKDEILPRIWYLALYLHVIGGSISLGFGPFIFLEKTRIRRISLHRQLGKFYLLGILLGGLSGLYMAFYATGSWVSKTGFGMLAVFWLVTGIMAYSSIRRKEIEQHQNWMIRNYALTLGAVALRIWMPIFLMFFGRENFDTSYLVIAWISWVPNLVIAELVIGWNKQKFSGFV
ncbi:DUF2306 domain-containing protein [Ammoniphilus resinae]|uniref:Membrane protein n=1 Tax=Ammoniphilus resinae TaxID=861532 RepID=A0ABS4GWS1_9BACL|nr:DUF2306 domain-containing protein [Ammoniphilus resinae]MBP1934477.1 putative membrane protein [Ammoniphilus resinae]